MRTYPTEARSRARTATAAVSAVAAGLALTACAGADEAAPGVSEDTVTVGTHTPLTGPAAAGYAGISSATKAYFDYVNDNGGIHGRSIEYVIKDDGYNPANTQTVVRELVQQDEVFAILNGLGTPTHSSVLDFLNQNEVPDLFVASGATVWNQPEEYPYTFAFNVDYAVEGGALAQHVLDEDPDTTICVLGQDDDFGETFLEGVTYATGEDGVAVYQEYSTANQDVTAQIGAFQAAGCEAVLLATINGFTALAVGTAAQMGYFPAWGASSSGGDYPTLVDLLGGDLAPQLLQGFVTVNYLQNAPGNEWTELFREINDEYNGGAVFDGNVVYGMSIGYTFAEALLRAGEEPTREALVEAIQSGELVGNGGFGLTYAEGNHAAYDSVQIAVVDGGVQDFLDGAAYQVTDGSVTAVEPQPVPLANGGIPAP